MNCAIDIAVEVESQWLLLFCLRVNSPTFFFHLP